MGGSAVFCFKTGKDEKKLCFAVLRFGVTLKQPPLYNVKSLALTLI